MCTTSNSVRCNLRSSAWAGGANEPASRERYTVTHAGGWGRVEQHGLYAIRGGCRLITFFLIGVKDRYRFCELDLTRMHRRA